MTIGGAQLRALIALFTSALLLASIVPAHALAEGPASARPGTCLGGSCLGRPMPLPPASDPSPGGCGVSRVAAITGIVGAVATLGGGVVLGLDRSAEFQSHHERVTWGLFASGVAVLSPLVALGAYITRRRCKVSGHSASRVLGWTAYGGALPVAAYAWVQAWRGYAPALPLTVGIAAAATLSVLPHAFDAYLGARQARGPRLSVQLGPVTTLSLRF